jgi:hypothetical protein
MTAERVPALLTAGLLLGGLALVLVLQPYSATSPWVRFDVAGQQFLEAALQRDTGELAQLSAAPQPVRWALAAAETERNALAAWATSARASHGFSRGDTTEVWYDTPTHACPFRLTFVGQRHPKVVGSHARCYTWHGWPTDPSVVAIPR